MANGTFLLSPQVFKAVVHERTDHKQPSGHGCEQTQQNEFVPPVANLCTNPHKASQHGRCSRTSPDLEKNACQLCPPAH